MSQRLKFRPSPDFTSSDSETEEIGPLCKVPRLLSSWRIGGGPAVVRKPILRTARRPVTENIVHKLWTREHFGKFNSRLNGKCNELPFKKIPERLRFCLRDILPYCYLDDHVFMGLTACGQFLMSYTVSFEEEEDELTQNYSFTNNGYKYKLFFWIYRPNCMLTNFYQVCLFDDHGVDNMKTVSMTQWVSNPRILVVHGASDCENEESYLSYVAVPKLGCRDCSEIRKSESDENCKTDTLCIRCNLTIHTKYTRNDSDPQLVSRVNFNDPDYLVTVSNGFIHALHVKLEKPQQQQRLMPKTMSYAYQQLLYSPFIHSSQDHTQTMDEIELNFGGSEREMTVKQKPTTTNANSHDNQNYINNYYHNNCSPSADRLAAGEGTSGLLLAKTDQDCATTMVANIIADFAECETKSNNNNLAGKSPEKGRMFFSGSVSQQMRLRREKTTTSTNSNANISPKVDSYEFSEETEERCEKISLFRKKRLADKKYEFSEDNSENIIPFNRINRTKSSTNLSNLTGNASLAAICNSSSPNYFEMAPHAHRGSPNYGFRSPCGSPIGNRCLRSPVGYYPSALSPSSSAAGTGASGNNNSNAGMFSPKHQYHFKRFNSLPPYVFSSPKRSPGEQLQEILPSNYQIGVTPLMPPPAQQQQQPPVITVAMGMHSGENSNNSATTITSPLATPQDEKMVFSKKVVRRFVEETDAASVITNEEDDCISPGYHTSLPMEVHGSCYSIMHMISKASAQKLHCPIVQITQNSFDLDHFTFYVANHICEKHEKKYGVFYDWACELVAICKYSGIATCVLAVHFTATDKLLPPRVGTGVRGNVKTGFFSESTSEPTAINLNKSDSGDAGNYDCINCSSNLDCVFHRKHYHSLSMFTWDVATGDWTVLEYGELVEMGQKWRNQSTKKQTTILRDKARKMADQLRGCTGEGGDDELGWNKRDKRRNNVQKEENGTEVGEELDEHLRVLDSCNVKSKQALTDLRNCIEFYRGTVAQEGLNDLSDFYENNSSDEDDEAEEDADDD